MLGWWCSIEPHCTGSYSLTYLTSRNWKKTYFVNTKYRTNTAFRKPVSNLAHCPSDSVHVCVAICMQAFTFKITNCFNQHKNNHCELGKLYWQHSKEFPVKYSQVNQWINQSLCRFPSRTMNVKIANVALKRIQKFMEVPLSLLSSLCMVYM